MPHSFVQRAQIVLAFASGDTNTAVANRFGVRGSTVGKWRQRYLDLGIGWLHDELRTGRPRTDEDDKVADVINRTLQTQPAYGSTHWSARSLAADLLGAAEPPEDVPLRGTLTATSFPQIPPFWKRLGTSSTCP